ncbi:MAG TPA: hypothetical protein VJ963_06550 [Bacteroidales bacterium]|nr:hypothetical protein [Bacteroidales bacterium]
MKKLIISLALTFFLNVFLTARPAISFFCELQGNEFNVFFADTSLIRQLSGMHASLRIGLHDFSPERALTIRKLNEAGIPVVAWLLLPEEDGYWFNMNNGQKASKRYDDFLAWTKENDLKWDGIGIDLEPDMNDGKMVFTHPWKLAWKVYKRLYDNRSLKKAAVIYQDLIDRMKDDGYSVESYIIPFIYDERELGTTSLQKLMGIVDIKTDIEIPMVYTSAMGNSAIIPLYHHDHMPLALGSTGGGVKINGAEIASLSWENLKKDMLVAAGLTDEIHIFSLEGSVDNGYLPGISKLDYSEAPPDLSTQIVEERSLIKKVRFFLVILNHPFWLTFAILAVMSGIIFAIYKLLSAIIRLITRA